MAEGLSYVNRPLATVWVCNSLAIVIMLARLILGRVCKRKFGAGDALTCAAIFLSIARIAFTHVVVLWKTNNIHPSLGEEGIVLLGVEEVGRRVLGSQFTLVARFLYILLLWIQKSVLLVFYSGIVMDLPWGRKALMSIWVLLAVTLIACVFATFTGCHPFDHYWKILPQTDRCTKAIPQLFVVGGTNMLTDILLMLLPIPVLWGARLDWQKKIQLGFLFSIGFVIITVTAVRLPRTLHSATSETTRIIWTTGEFLAATFVANAPTLYSFHQRFHQKKQPRVRNVYRTGPHIRVVDLNGTTFTGFPDYSSETRGSGDIEHNPVTQVSEVRRPIARERTHSITKMLFGGGASNSNG